MLHGDGIILGVLRSSLGYARDFACELGRPQRGSTSSSHSHRLRSLVVGQDDNGKGQYFHTGAEARVSLSSNGTDKSVP